MSESDSPSISERADAQCLDAYLHELAGVAPATDLAARIAAACDRATPATQPFVAPRIRWWWAAALFAGLGAVGGAAWWRAERRADVSPANEVAQEPARQSSLSTQVAEQWRRSIGVLADTKAGDEAVTLEAARNYAERTMTEDIATRIATQLRLHPDDVRALWSGRAKVESGMRTVAFDYGVGSWVLGGSRILEGAEPGAARARDAQPKETGNSRDVQRLARAMREALERRRAAGREREELTAEGWWRSASRTERASWLCAYYAEFGGQMVVTAASVSPCLSCEGEGSVPEVNPEGRLVRNTCFLCQGTKWLRSFEAY